MYLQNGENFASSAKLWSTGRMIVAMHHPEYLPQISWFARLSIVDALVVLDDTAMPDRNREAWLNRGRIRSANSTGTTRLTVPVLRHPRGLQFCDVIINPTSNWNRSHLRSIESSYRRSAGFDQHRSWLRSVYHEPPAKLLDLTWEMIRYYMKVLSIDPGKLVLASSLSTGSRNPAEVTEALGGTIYAAGPAEIGRIRSQREALKSKQISLASIQLASPVYKQPYRPFVPNLSILDLLLSAGDNATEILSTAEVRLEHELEE